jgi:hypothetical protein
MNNDGYYYLHTNRDLIFKPAMVITDPSYFDSPFVRKVWPIRLQDRGTAYLMLIDAQAMGAKVERITELRMKWAMTDEDTQIWADRMGFKLFRVHGDQWCATLPTFINLIESAAGFGNTRWDALVELCREVKANKEEKLR